MGNSINQQEGTIASIASSESFSKLADHSQIKVMEFALKEKEIPGAFARLFGTNHDNMQIYVGILIACIVSVMVGIMLFRTQDPNRLDIINVLIPILTLVIGYIFGKAV